MSLEPNSSLALNLGETLSNSIIGDFDFFSAQRIVDQTIDIGAHEYNSLDSHIEISSNEICIRPNPFVHMVIIDGDFTSFQIEILDIHGNVVSNYSNSSAPLNINLDHLGSGIFLLKITNDNEIDHWIEKMINL